TYCDICGQDFANSETLRQHKSTHYFCDTCELEFDSSDQLREHRLESVNHNYCNDCDEDFPTVSDLDYHWQSSHWHADNNGWDISDSPSEPVAFIEESSGEDWVERFLRLSLDLGPRQTSFYCSDCDRYFKTSNGLDQHRATASVHRNARVPRSVSTPDEDRCNKQGYSCPLCFDQGEDLSSAKCGHVFCTT
ncbi:uncharacterized protein FOMMEDRAFT_92422, partial [Fomitiporia mediterranea MF3/22]|uniref:uncharacterized protein n=1 Tax=Fomitiporia mediterranea (strain MF3/22) TaxID=694068 RepID=UPI0004408527